LQTAGLSHEDHHEQIPTHRSSGKRKQSQQTKASQLFDLFFGDMTKALTNGERIEIRGLCNIFVKEYRGYTGGNPATKEAVSAAPKKLPFFTCGKELKERVDS
jgi:integration host factor subunit beta